MARQLELDEDGHIKVAGGPRSCPSPVAKTPGRTAEINEVFADGSAERLDDGPPRDQIHMRILGNLDRPRRPPIVVIADFHGIGGPHLHDRPKTLRGDKKQRPTN